MTPVAIVAELPDPATYSGSTFVYCKSDGNLYRLAGGSWTFVMTPIHVAALIGPEKLAAIEAAKITAPLP